MSFKKWSLTNRPFIKKMASKIIINSPKLQTAYLEDLDIEKISLFPPFYLIEIVFSIKIFYNQLEYFWQIFAFLVFFIMYTNFG